MSGFARIREVLDSVRARVAEDRPLDYSGYSEIAAILGLPVDYLKGEGIFREWEQVIRCYDDVSSKLQEMIPASMYMPTVHEEKLLCAWLDWTRYFPPNEVEFQRARWFAFAVADIRVTPLGSDDDGEERAEVEISFTPEFAALVAAERDKASEQGAFRAISEDEMVKDFLREMSDARGESFDEAAFQAGFDADGADAYGQ